MRLVPSPLLSFAHAKIPAIAFDFDEEAGTLPMILTSCPGSTVYLVRLPPLLELGDKRCAARHAERHQDMFGIRTRWDPPP
jgi:hypothetical protein